MRVTIAPTNSGLAMGQHSASIEKSDDELTLVEVIEMFVTALMAYGCDEESIVAAFEHYSLSHQLETSLGDEDNTTLN